MWCQPVSVATSLLTGESLEVFYRKFPDLTWVPFLPNPITPNFDICGLTDGNYEVRIKKIQANGNACKESTKTFTIGTVVCIGVLPITYDLPNAQIGVPYNVSIPVSGTLPLTIEPTGISIPAWMTISVVGSTVVLSGMPSGVIASNIPVEFSVNNCGGTPVDFADTINVTSPVSGFVPVVTTNPSASNPVCYDDVEIDFNVGNSNFSFDIDLVGYSGGDQQSFDGWFPPNNIPAVGLNTTKTGAGTIGMTRLRATTGGGGLAGVSAFVINITEYYLGTPTGNVWTNVILGTLNSRVPCPPY